MVSAVGFLVLLLPLVAGNFQPANNSTTRSVLRITRILDDGQLERVTKWPGFCATETTVDWGDMEVTLREVWLDKAELKLRLIYAGGILNDCLEETYEETRRNGESEADCSSKLGLARDDESRMIVDEVDQSIPVDVSSPGDLTPRHLAFWFTTADDLRRECFRIKTKARNQILDRQEKAFRTCLKMAGTSSANFVGTLFFNMVQTKCFVLKRKKECVRRSWYGKCERFEYRKQAYIRSNIPY